MKPGAVRGNHYHLRRREAIVVLPGSSWSLHWDNGEGRHPYPAYSMGQQQFSSRCLPVHRIAARNEGQGTLWSIAFSSGAYDPAETLARKVV